MPKTSSYIKCPNCGVFNTDKEYCENCGTLISYQKKRALEVEKIKKEAVEEIKDEIENPNLAERLKKHPFFLYKIVGWFLYSIWLLSTAISMFIAWMIAMMAAG